MIELQNEIWSLSLDPERGGSIVSAFCRSGQDNGFQVFEPARPRFQSEGDVFASSCFPLIPFSNRIAAGQFSFDGERHYLVPNHPEHTFPIHGNGWENSWAVTENSPQACTMEFHYQPVTGDWPWAFKARQIVKLNGECLEFHLSIQNSSRSPFPAGLGLHPFFANAEVASIEFEARQMWECGDDMIPTRQVSLSGNNDFSSKRAIKGTRLDNCFEGWDGRAVIDWISADFNIELIADPVFSNLVVYIQPENGFFCLEPVSHVNNALNMTAERAMPVLQPGETLDGKITLKAQFKQDRLIQ